MAKPPRKSKWSADQTRAAREAIIKRDGPNCWLCGRGFKFMEKPTLDHVKPLSKGGAHRVSNMKLAHYACNTARGNRMIAIERMIERGSVSANEGRNG